MFKTWMNHIKILCTITPLSALLIKEGKDTADPSVPDMSFVRTEHYQLGHTVYLPGSSVKGVLRSHSEKIIRSAKGYVCDLFGYSCSSRHNINQDTPGKETYRLSCAICKTFGSTQLASHVRFSDAYPIPEIRLTEKDPNRTEIRCGVAIDRLLGSVAHGPFDLEIVTRGSFQSEIMLKNVALWQVGLLGLALKHLNDGIIQLGFAKSRGLGRVRLDINQITLAGCISNGVFKGITGTCTDGMLREYGLEKIAKYDQISLPSSEEDSEWQFGSWKDAVLVGTDAWELLRLCTVGPLSHFLDSKN